MNRSKIEWCDMTWNPATGCLHNCEYCYAKKIVKRFGICGITEKGIEELKKPYIDKLDGDKVSYPFGFKPTFHRYRLDEPQRIKKPQNIFVCSMADLFGDWVPDEWIQQVFEASAKAIHHRYLFLTKNPKRYMDLYTKRVFPDDRFWLGTTITKPDDPLFFSEAHNTFVSIEPIQTDFSGGKNLAKKFQWVIIGAETGNRKGKVIPKREWVENIVNECRKQNVPVFMKNSLSKIWAEPLIQEYPWKELVG